MPRDDVHHSREWVRTACSEIFSLELRVQQAKVGFDIMHPPHGQPSDLEDLRAALKAAQDAMATAARCALKLSNDNDTF
jgi:hypothetical protein